ncbi:MAG TPA: sugar phosphate isomerase/epimerase family protein [Candidatus Dormibacteraeota bacterium]|nr:sugar phosphate isomerase/epimerase family protein [Candidatus Dormibacteraeota bacterium]
MSTPSIGRRDFLEQLAIGLVALPAGLTSGPEPAHAAGERLPIGFSTLGCPSWNWLKVLDFAQQNGFAAVELRGLEGTMDLPARPEFAEGQIEQSRKEIADRGLRISCVGSSANLHDTGPEHENQLGDARGFIDLASRLGAPYVRVFGNKLVGERDAAVKHIGASLRELGDYAGPKDVTVLLESHGDFVNSAILRDILEKAASAHVALLWDAHNTFVDGKEDPAVSVTELGKYIRHTHLKDSRMEGGKDHYVLTGRGDVPVKRQVELLAATGYAGYYSFEWEKAWHPDIEEPEVAIADYARVMTQYLQTPSKQQKRS